MFRLTPVVKILLALNVLVYVLEFLCSGLVISGLPFKMWFMQHFALMPWDGLSVGFGQSFDFQPWQLLSYQFMHGSFWHIFFNMFMLWMFGLELEELWGSAKFLVFYLLCGIGAGIAHMLMGMFLGQIAPAIGASGSIYGLFFGFIMLGPNRRMIIFPIFIPLKAKWIGLGMVAISIIGGLSGSDGIAHFAHLGGGIMGALLVKLGEHTPLFRVVRKFLHFGLESSEFGSSTWQSPSNAWNTPRSYSAKWETPHSYKTPPSGFTANRQTTDHSATTAGSQQTGVNIGGQRITQADVDAILDKISQAGYASLTEQEKYILTEISKKM